MRKPFRIIVALLVLALVASACSKAGNVTPIATAGKYGSGVDLKAIDKENQTVAEQANGPSKLPHTIIVKQQGSYTAGTNGSSTHPVIQKHPLDNGTTGGNAYWYLAAKTPKLVVEIDAVQGEAPSNATIQILNRTLHQVADKPGGIQFLPVQTIPRRNHWSTSDASNAEEKYRQSHNSLQAASLYLLFVNGDPDQSGVLGIAYSSSSDVLYEDQVRSAGTPLVSVQAIEQAVVTHEVGHLLSLVNMTYKSPRLHEDPNHPGHSNNQNSVMYWAIDNVGVATLLGGHTQPPYQYDADDLADLRDVKAGKLGPH